MTIDKAQAWARSYGAWIIGIFHAVGLVLLGGDWRHDLVVLTPLNLLLLAGLYGLASQKPQHLVAYFAPILLGFIIEVVGTNTGVPFGEYRYSGILGPGLWNTPLMIGVLWWVLLRSFYDLAGRWMNHRLLRTTVTAALMVGLDFLIEPVAIELDFWKWSAAEVPVQNYAAWFIASFVFAWLTHKGNERNVLSGPVAVILWGFFAILGVLYA